MKPRDLFIFFAGWLAGAIVTVLFIDRREILKRIENYFRKNPIGYTLNGPRRGIEWRKKGEKVPARMKRWPSPHPGGAAQSEIYQWAAEFIRRTGKGKPDAFKAVGDEFPGYISDEKLTRDAQYNAFRSGVARALKNLPLETPAR